MIKLVATLSLLLGPLAMAAPSDALHAVLADYDRLQAIADPIDAAQRGDLEAARRWPDPSPAAIAKRAQALTALEAKLKAIAPASLSGADALNRDLLLYDLDMELEGIPFDEARIPFTSDSGFFDLPGYAADNTQLRNRAEADAYLARLAALPDYLASEMANLRRGVATGFTQPRLVAQAGATMARTIADHKAEDSPLLRPIAEMPASFPIAEREAIKKQALELIVDRIKPAEQAVADFFTKEYLPKARPALGTSTLPKGRAYYAYLVRRETTTGMTPDQVYKLGQSEIVRIRAEMNKVIAETGFKGDFKAFLAFLRSDPQFYVTSREALLEKASRLAKRADDQLPKFFGLLPSLTYGVRPVPADIEEGYTSGRYNPGSPEQGVAGGLMINTSHLDQRPLYELPALVAHEGAPGHHLQGALAQEMKDVPTFRLDDAFTAYMEGWALYSEGLASEMGLYDTPYERFGRLSMEMWRACRLVMDVGIHWKGMGRDEAAACLRDNSALAEKNIQTETDRYISWPGQALGYKIGQLKILELRHRAEAKLGADFDLRRFHDLILDQGAMPMQSLEARVDRWIAVGGR